MHRVLDTINSDVQTAHERRTRRRVLGHIHRKLPTSLHTRRPQVRQTLTRRQPQRHRTETETRQPHHQLTQRHTNTQTKHSHNTRNEKRTKQRRQQLSNR
ncbi:hypothetical protein, partial [Actinophytocola oryzae]|uniref:hypothetical protein n=1 Tax=Actinophytocola oryzae TaxID=502181 RepID=UPI0010642207